MASEFCVNDTVLTILGVSCQMCSIVDMHYRTFLLLSPQALEVAVRPARLLGPEIVAALCIAVQPAYHVLGDFGLPRIAL